MPTVPTYNGPQVAQQPLGGRVVEDPLANELDRRGQRETMRAPNLDQVTQTALSIWQDEKRKQDQIAVTGASSALSDLETKLTVAAKSKTGANAFTTPDETSEAWQSGTQDIEKTLANDEQRIAFQNAKAAHWNQLNATVQGHVAEQRQVYDTQTTNGYLGNEANAAINADTTKPEGLARVSTAIKNTTAAIRDYGTRNGLSTEYTDEHVKEAASKIHAAVIDRMLANDQDLLASSYYKEHKAEIVGDQAVSVNRSLEEGSLRGESQRQADAIMAQNPATLTEAIAKVREISDPKVRDAVQQRVTQDFQIQNEATARARESAMTQAGNILDKSPSITSIPASMWVQFTPSEKSQLRSYADALSGGSGEPKTDWQVWSDRVKEASVDPDAFMSRNLMMDRSKLGNAQFIQLTELQASLRGKDESATTKAQHLATPDQIVKRTLGSVGIGVDQTAGQRMADAPIIDEVYRGVYAEIDQEQAQTGKPVSTADVQRITDELVTLHVILGEPSGWNNQRTRTAPLYDLKPGERLVLTAKDIPATERQALATALRQQGLPVTEQTLIRAYGQHLISLPRRGPSGNE